MTAVSVEPLAEPPDVVVRVPGSKSFTNRALVCAALAEGRSRLTGVLMADDTEAMVGGIRTLGATVDIEDASGLAPAMVVEGTGGVLAPGPATIDARQSGTTARFLAAVVCRGEDAYRIDGDAQLKARPMGSLFAALRELGASVIEEGAPGHLPVAIRGGWHADQVEVAGDISSQYLTALLLAAPGRPEGLRVELTTPLVSRPFVAMTATTMAAFGAEVTVADTWCRVGPPPYVACDYEIEPDASAASYFFAAAALTGGRVEVDGLPPSSRQGDLGLVDLLARMGAEVERGSRSIAVRGTGPLHGINANLADIPDMVPTIAALAAFADGPTEISGVGFVRHHESDRLAAVVDALGRCGVEAHEEPDGVLILPKPDGPRGAAIDPHGDHRMAMAFALVGLRVPGVQIEGAECVGKTFPDYFTVLEGLRR